MTNGISLHIGLNSVDPASYSGWSGPLNACESDAEDMAQIAKSTRFKASSLLTAAATRKGVAEAIGNAAAELVAGDTFFLSYSGHGGQLPDRNGDEPDGVDETWCLYDGELVDDQLYAILGRFAAGVRILALSDSCHSGTVLKDAALRARRPEVSSYRAMPAEVAMRVYREHRAEYDAVLSDITLISKQNDVKASGLLISGCQDNQLSLDGTFNGLFTGTLIRVWKEGNFKGSYTAFHKAIAQQMPADQSPKLFRVGPRDMAFEGEQPFTIDRKS